MSTYLILRGPDVERINCLWVTCLLHDWSGAAFLLLSSVTQNCLSPPLATLTIRSENRETVARFFQILSSLIFVKTVTVRDLSLCLQRISLVESTQLVLKVYFLATSWRYYFL